MSLSSLLNYHCYRNSIAAALCISNGHGECMSSLEHQDCLLGITQIEENLSLADKVFAVWEMNHIEDDCILLRRADQVDMSCISKVNCRKEVCIVRSYIYSELLGVSVITVVLPAWYQALSPEKKRHWFNKLKLNILIRATIILLGFGWDDIQIAYIGPGHENFEGKSVAQIAREMGKSCLDAYLDLCEMSDFKGRVNMGPYSTPEIVSELSKEEMCLYMTDAWVEDYGIQNPAIYDCFPKFLKYSLCGTGDTMPNTIRKMTSAVADRFSIQDRGKIKPGYYADLTVFDENKLRDGIPDQKQSFGIEKVYINGIKVLDNDVLDTEAIKHSGRAMRA